MDALQKISEGLDLTNAFNTAFTLVTDKLVPDELKQVIVFHNDLIMKTSPWLLFDDEMIEILSDNIFNEDIVRNFIMNIHTTFMFSIDGNTARTAVIQRMASGSIINDVNAKGKNTSAPFELHKRLLTQKQIAERIEKDPWLITVFMLFFVGLKKVNIEHENK